MRTRIKSALIMAPLLIIVFLGGWFLVAGVFMLSVLAIREFCSAFGEKRPAAWVMYTSLIVLYAFFIIQSPLTPMITTKMSVLMFIWIFISLFLAFISMFNMEKRDLLQGMATIAGIFYINFFAFHLVLVSALFSDQTAFRIAGTFSVSGFVSFVWIILLAALGTDIFAYFTGKLFGKHKLCPSISPQKTIEGAIGGITGSVILCVLFGNLFLMDRLAFPIPGISIFIIIGVAGGIISQFGDLSASVMKRKIGIKDWGTLIPGHGGVLDRIDSILFVAPLVYYICVILILIQTWFIN